MDRSERTSRTVAVIGGTLWGNRGAEAMLTTTIGRIREFAPETQFSIFSYYPDKDRELCNDANIEFLDCRPVTLALRTFPLSLLAWLCKLLRLRVPSHWFGKEVDRIRSAEVLIDIGGITFCDGREVFLPFNILTVLPALMMRVPVVKLSQAMGPFRGFLNRMCAMPVLGRCEKVFARGAITLSHLNDAGLRADLFQQAADVAFSYKPEFALSEESVQEVSEVCRWAEQSRGDGTKLFTFVPSSLVMQKNQRYIQRLADCIAPLIKEGHDVLLLPNATRAGIEKARNNDLVAIKAVVESVASMAPELSHKVRAVDFDVNTAGLREMMQFSDLVVTSRFHGMVAALALRIPVFVIGWSHKYEEVLADFQCPGNAVDYGSDSDDLTRQIASAFHEIDRLRSSIDENLERVERSSMLQFEFLSQRLGGTEPAGNVDQCCVTNTPGAKV